ncbi:hypothetical protein [Brachybacterium paraconglomeratum]|uniref:hypothetical protein n=1 Tax=Brachybacterium paraconglomeratum TaxID=173362 RepID=UPI0031E856BC
MSWKTHLLGAAFYTAGTCGMLGAAAPPLSNVGLGLGLGALLLAIGTIIVSRAQLRHHGRASSLPAVVGPRSLLSGWVAGGPLLFHLLLPDTTPVSVSVLLSLLLGTVFYTVFRLEDAERTAQAASKPAA